ncbi:DUF485 domain-containing protein [Pseudomonas typographi]|uniref:DUF485 domain-containing protein n=1 Tax=Pseudomonas typographi TaxID=2715964 RepID=A0ABR7Z3D3_9PSED|nr:DUF485 domain-containing protein [Pseudomonas typographi]MBD1599859.1 DUF485 domain-containing protein [Pseudomonas typographi]
MKQDSIWGAIFEHPNFAILVKRRRRLVSTLMLISMAVYFAIPLFSAYFPEFLSYKIYGAINVGLVYLVGQYFFGAAIAIFYAWRLKNIDAMSAALVSEASVSVNHDQNQPH